jgi:WD40 repeat protein
MKRLSLLLIICLSTLSASCNLSQGELTATATQDVGAPSTTQTAPAPIPSPTPTTTVAPLPVPEESSTPIPPPQTRSQLIAYEREGQLLVTDVTDGMQGGTSQYTVAGENDQVTNITWSPSGEFVAFTSAAKGEPHLFYIFALGQSSPVDLGPGSSPAWSSDSQSIAYIRGTFPDDNIWVTTIENPSPRQLTFETNYAWGKPIFTPDGGSLIVAGADRFNMGASGNTSFTLEYLTLDGSSTRTPLPGTTVFDGARLPYDLEFSPDGTLLAFSTSFHLSACASPGAYYVSNADGSNRQELISPFLMPAIDLTKEYYHVGLSYGWSPFSDALVISGNVVDCNFSSPTIGQTVAGPQMSILGLDGSEHFITPGTFYGLSMDRSGTLVAASHYKDYQDLNPMLEIYSTQTGLVTLVLGAGRNPQFQP